MNPFLVQWEPQAEQELARLWLAAPDRNAIAQAQHRIDQRLARTPLKEGDELSEELYYIVEKPLAAFYEIHLDQKLVVVTQVTLAHQSPSSGTNGKL